jgi:hypothetical protein
VGGPTERRHDPWWDRNSGTLTSFAMAEQVVMTPRGIATMKSCSWPCSCFVLFFFWDFPCHRAEAAVDHAALPGRLTAPRRGQSEWRRCSRCCSGQASAFAQTMAGRLPIEAFQGP